MTRLVPAGMRGFGWTYSNAGAPSSTPGTAITPGASDAEGSWTQIASGANIAEDVYDILLTVTEGNTSAQSKMHLLDIGSDPAAGTSYVARASNLQVGGSATYSPNSGCLRLKVPCFIPAGSTVAVRIQGGNATAGTVNVWAIFYGRPAKPEYVQKLVRSETLGTVTGSRGVVVAPGVSGAEGAWVEIGTTTFAWRYLIPTLQIDDATASAQALLLDVGSGDGSLMTILAENIAYHSSGGEALSGGPAANSDDLWSDIPSGTRLWARISVSSGAADSNNAVLITGLG